jgi:hypothetical protein
MTLQVRGRINARTGGCWGWSSASQHDALALTPTGGASPAPTLASEPRILGLKFWSAAVD